MEDILRQIFGMDSEQGQLLGSVYDRAKNFHRRIVIRWFMLAIFIIAGMFWMNIRGNGGWNLIPFFVFFIATILTSVCPEALLGVLSLGVLSGTIKTPQTISQEIVVYFRNYFENGIGEILLWLSIVSMFLTTLYFGNNPKAFPFILMALIVIKLAGWKWDMGFTLYKKVIYYYAICLFIYAMLTLVPGSWWVVLTGHDIPNYFGVSQSTEALTRFQKAKDALQEESVATRAGRIADDMENGIYPSKNKRAGQEESDAEFIERIEKEKTIPGKFKNLFSSITPPSNWKTCQTIPLHKNYGAFVILEWGEGEYRIIPKGNYSIFKEGLEKDGPLPNEFSFKPDPFCRGIIIQPYRIEGGKKIQLAQDMELTLEMKKR